MLQVVDMLINFTDMWDGYLGTIRSAKHRIDLETPEEKPVHSAPYWDGRTTSKLETPIVFLMKYGTLRFCVDFRRLNALTIQESY